MAEFNPVLVKELRGRMRGARAFVLLSVFLVLLSGIMLLVYAVAAGEARGSLNAGRQIGQGLFYLLTAAALTGVCLITPTLTTGSIAGERERQTFDLLVASQLSSWQIVLGKLGSALAFALLMILAVVPLMSMAFLFGGVALSEVLIVLVCMVMSAVLYASVGVFWSALMRSTLSANSLAIGTIVVVLLGIPFLAVLAALASGFGGFWTESALAVYVARLFLCLHPFFALYFTESAIIEGRGLFLESVPLGNGGSTLVPSGWVLFVLLAALLTALLLLLSVRMVRPVEEAVGKPAAG